VSIRDKIRCLEYFVSKVAATRNANFSQRSTPGDLTIKREVKHSFELPKKKGDSFRITLSDRLTFGKGQGPFSMEITLRGVVFLNEEINPAELASILKDKDNIDFLVNQGLPYSCSTVAYLTERMGFSPIILAPKSFSG
jgi:preprotein translocase subunit SecB